ncbi:MAG: hypothetical protein ACRCXK_09485 [Wohlfahrtiimonas sp.]
MLKLNTIMFYVGIVLTAIGVLVGFPFIFWGNQDVGMFFVTMIGPLGFLLFFTGFIGAIAFRPHTDRMQSEVESRKKAEAYQRTVPD